jgi:hypothetical protein
LDRLGQSLVVRHINFPGRERDLYAAYARVAQTKTLKKSSAARDVTHTTITLGVILAVEAAVPLEQLADELDRLNRQTPDTQWTDMVVVASHGLISYAVQFPGDPTEGDQADPDDDNADGDTRPSATTPAARGNNFHLAADRELARGWLARARDNIAATRLSKELEQSGRTPLFLAGFAVLPIRAAFYALSDTSAWLVSARASTIEAFGDLGQVCG